ncbi:hypothetical protein [Streptomyces sp. NPDC007100]|uniref:hypothetical protein n=1 Tax=Streptomyces sp. NPDC007100 TaxID=3155602 RepID=UPI0033E37583
MPDTGSLRAEEATAFAQVLGQALGSPEVKEALRNGPGTPGAERLRGQAYRSRAALLATAATEYRAYARLRAEEARLTAPPAEDVRPSGGLLPALAVLVPSLGAVAAVIFLAIGFGLRLVGVHRQFSDELVYAGWLAAAIAAAATVADLVWLLVTAARNRSAPPADGEAAPGADAGSGSEVARAREAWRLALLERGILPFLLGRIQEEQSRTTADRTRPGYSAPEYASPEYASPEYASPEYASPAYGSPQFGSPGYGSPEFAGPTATPARSTPS